LTTQGNVECNIGWRVGSAIRNIESGLTRIGLAAGNIESGLTRIGLAARSGVSWNKALEAKKTGLSNTNYLPKKPK